MSADLDSLIKGFSEYKRDAVNFEDKKYKGLLELGQDPSILMIACCDSRVDPAIITNCDAGDMLVVRNIANLVPPYIEDEKHSSLQAAIEFAICYSQVKDIVVMGHSRCAGIRTLLNRVIDDLIPSHPLEQWTQVAEPAARAAVEEIPLASLDEQTCLCSRKAVGISLDNLKEYPWVKHASEKGALNVHGWYFNLAKAELETFDQNTGLYTLISD
jgi:carbonic anhydrase